MVSREIGWGVHQSETSKKVRREMLSKMKEDSVEPRAKVEGCVECELCDGVVDGTCEQSLSSRC